MLSFSERSVQFLGVPKLIKSPTQCENMFVLEGVLGNWRLLQVSGPFPLRRGRGDPDPSWVSRAGVLGIAGTVRAGNANRADNTSRAGSAGSTNRQGSLAVPPRGLL